MKTSEKGLRLLKHHEGLRLTAYLCPAGVWTIGYGHTGGVVRGMVITRDQADSYLISDAAVAERAVLRNVKVPLTQGQFDALVSFVFNLGEGRLKSSTLLRKLNQKDYAGADAEFARWVYGNVNGKNTKLNGLITRRSDEQVLFRSK